MNAASRRHFLAGSAAAVGLAGVSAGLARLTGGDTGADHAAEPAPRPNIVLILADDLGYGEAGCYGQRLIDTPRLDELAAEGMRFTQAYAPAPVCAPSRCSLLTGLHSGHATVRENPFHAEQGALGATDTTFAEVLQERGYRTACIGKWGFGPERPDQPSHPNRRGFDEFYGYISHHAAHDYYPDHLWQNGTRFAVPGNALGRQGTYAPDLFRDRALDFLTEHATRIEHRRQDGTTGEPQPFLLYLAPTTPHAPSRRIRPGAYAHEPGWSRADKGHAAQVAHFDTTVGRVVDTLRRTGLDRDTVVLVTSDNGPHDEGGVDPELFDANGPLRGYKRNLYEGGVRVPFLAWAPGRVRPGQVSDRITPLTDLLPTFAELAGARVPDHLDGLSIARMLRPGEGRPRAHPYLYWYRNDPFATGLAGVTDAGRGRSVCEAVREGRWKALRFAPGRDREVHDATCDVELYDLRRDPGEQHDVAAAHPEIADRLVARMRASWRPPAGAVAGA